MEIGFGQWTGDEYRRGNIASVRKPIQNHTVYLSVDSSAEKMRPIVKRENLPRSESALRGAKRDGGGSGVGGGGGKGDRDTRITIADFGFQLG